MAARSVSSMASITRNAVGTEATAPKTSACRRRPSRFARASPPPAMVTTRSEITLPGSCRRRRLHIGASASDKASVSPERSAISASRRLPAWVASPLPSAVTFNAGRHLVAFTWYVPSCLGSWCLDNPIFPGQEGFFADLPPLRSTVNERCGLVGPEGCFPSLPIGLPAKLKTAGAELVGPGTSSGSRTLRPQRLAALLEFLKINLTPRVALLKDVEG